MALPLVFEKDSVLLTHVTNSGTVFTLSHGPLVRGKRIFKVVPNGSFPDSFSFSVLCEEIDLENKKLQMAKTLFPFIVESYDVLSQIAGTGKTRELYLEVFENMLSRRSDSSMIFSPNVSEIDVMVEFTKNVMWSRNYSCQNIAKEKIGDFAHSHVGLFDGTFPTTAERLEIFADPINAQYGFEIYPFMKAFPKGSPADFRIKEVRELILRTYGAMVSTEVDKNSTPIKDFPLIGADSITALNTDIFDKFFELPVRQKEFRDFIQDLTLPEMEQIFGNLRKTMEGEVAVDLSKKILADYHDRLDDSDVDYFSFAHHTFQKLFPLIAETKSSWSAKELYGKIMDNYENYNGMKVLNAVLSEEIHKATDAFNLVNTFLEWKHSASWIKTRKDRNIVLHLLLTKMTGLEAAEMILITIDLDVIPTLEQWMEYIERYDELRDTPKSWWVNLV